MHILIVCFARLQNRRPRPQPDQVPPLLVGSMIMAYKSNPGYKNGTVRFLCRVPWFVPSWSSHPDFNERSFGDATEYAWARNRLCLVYIAADRGRGGKAAKVDDAICKTLADSQVTRGASQLVVRTAWIYTSKI